MQELLYRDPGVDRCATFSHSRIQLDIRAAGIGEPQPAVDAVFFGTSTLFDLDAPFTQAGTNDGQALFAGSFVTNPLHPPGRCPLPAAASAGRVRPSEMRCRRLSR